MTERLVDISARIDNVEQLDTVVTAMRGIAASRAQRSRALLSAIEAYAGTTANAIGEAVGLLDSREMEISMPAGRHAWIVFCAEHGFAGGLSDRILNALGADATGAILMLVGSRGSAIARERGIAAHWTTAMASQIGSVLNVAGRVADALYARIVSHSVSHCGVLYPRIEPDQAIRVAEMPLFPLRFEAFRRSRSSNPPLVTLEPERLLERLAGEYIFARLCQATMEAFAAENQARMEAMSAAGSNVERMLTDLKQRQNQIRQEEVTAEIVELAMSASF